MKLRNIKAVYLIILFYCFASLKFMYANGLPIQDEKENKQEIIYYEKALELHDLSKYPQAEKLFLQTVELAIEKGEKEILAYSFHYLGRIEEWKSDYSQSLVYHRKALKLFHELKNVDYIAFTNNSIASVHEYVGLYDSSLIYYSRNIENRNNISPYASIISYQNIASLYAKLYNYKLAYLYLQEGIEFAEGIGNKLLLAKLYFIAGKLFLNNHVNKDIALEYLQESKKLFTELNYLQYIGKVELSIGNVYLKSGNDSLALQNFKKVIANAHKISPVSLSEVNHLIGKVYKKRHQYDTALVYFHKSIGAMCKECPEILAHGIYLDAAHLYLLKGEPKQAYFYLDKAKDIAVKTESGLEMAVSFNELAAYYQSIQMTDSALFYLIKSHNLAKELGLLENIKETAESLSKIYYSRNEYKASSDYLRIAKHMNDSLASIEKYNEIAKLEMKFEIERKEEERKLEESRLQNKIIKEKLIRKFSIAGIILFFGIVLLLYRAYRRKVKDNLLLAKQKNEIQKMVKLIQESGKRKLNFFTNISHEIRTPLTLIQSPLERIIQAKTIDKELQNQLEPVLNNTKSLKGLVNQILDLEKMDEHRLNLNYSTFEIVSFCKEIAESFKEYCSQGNYEFSFESNASEAVVKFDKVRLNSIINNLLSNAFKYNKENGDVQFKLTINNQKLELEIKDTGKGISSEHIKNLGDRYYRIEHPETNVEGTGIGLTYVKETVNLMNGEFKLSSSFGVGTTVTVTLPCKEIEIKSPISVHLDIHSKGQFIEKIKDQLAEEVEVRNTCILIIEDNFELRTYLKDLFKTDYIVICAKDGQKGKELAMQYIPDLIISDIMMPGIKGNKLCKILKDDIKTCHIPIILFTAKGAHDSIVDGYDCGADDYIVKPFNFDLLVKKVNNILSTVENIRKQFNFIDIEHNKTTHSETDKNFLQDCFSVINENLRNSSFTVELLAENLGFHKKTLTRKFKSLTGKLPNELIRHARMTKAALLVQEKKYRINEIAKMVGYEDSNRFSSAFKQFHGVVPSSYN